jgi:hypothetical protein
MDSMKYTKLEDQPVTGAGREPGAVVDPTPLLGTWHSTDKATRGIVKLVLTAKDGALIVHAYGACEPELCDWGAVRGEVFAANVSGREAMAFTAVYDFGFMETSLAVYYKGGILVLDSFNAFKDDSGRSSYFTREFYHS